MQDKMNIADNNLKLKGHIKVELFNADTGEKEHEVEGDNFISLGTEHLMKMVQRRLLTHNVPNNYAATVVSDLDPFTWIVLTDSEMAESKATEYLLPGNVIGYANKLPYSDTNILRGAIAQNESYANNEKIHLVWDFLRDRANGTFRSICLSRGIDANTFVANSHMGLTLQGKLVRSYIGIVFAEGFLWGAVSGVLYKINPTTFAEISSWSGFNSTGNLFYQGGIIYGVSTDIIYRFTISTSIVVSDTRGVSGSTRGILSDGNFLYISTNNNQNIYKWNFDLTLVSTKTFSEVTSFGFGQPFFKDGNIYFIGDNSVPYLVDYEAGTATAQPNIYINGTNPLTFDGTDFWTTQTNSNSYNNSNVSAPVLYKMDTTKGRANIMSRKLLPAPVTKTDSQIMTITYDILME